MHWTRNALGALSLLALVMPAQSAEPTSPAPAAGAPPQRARPARPSITASSPLTATGTFVRTSEKTAFFAGSLNGTFGVKEPKGPAGPLEGAAVSCAGVFHIDLSNEFQEGEGRCSLTARNGDQVFADWECGGEKEKGCKGSFEISGGTGGLQGIDGGGDFLLPKGVAGLAAAALGKTVTGAQAGTAEWPKLSLHMP
jgi:hypothetical protein